MSEVLATIRHEAGLPAGGRVLERRAVKAVVRPGSEVLLPRTAEAGALKFPGGGDELGQVVQLARPKEAGYDVFRMVSRYVYCTAGAGSGRQRLERYEQRLGLTPVWLDVSAAAEACASLLASGTGLPRWFEREHLVLRLLEDGS